MSFYKNLLSFSVICTLLLVILYGFHLNKIETDKLSLENIQEIVSVKNSGNSEDSDELDNDEKQTIGIYENTSESVVYITSFKTEYINYFFDVVPQTSEGQGSGVIIDKDGYIVTNYHVVGNADKLLVTLNNADDSFEAKIIGSDPENDLAIIKITSPPKDIKPIKTGTSSNLKIGQKVYAIGNPFGFDRTLTSGIISALGRSIKTDSGNVIDGAIQTDASINPGNSGGPLLNSSGKIIGINTMIVSPSRGSVGIGFAIPIDKVKEITPELIKFGYVKRGWIDATFLPVNARLSRALNLGIEQGLMVMQVATNGEAMKSGIRGGDKRAVYGDRIVYIGGEIITEVNSVKVTDYSSLVQILKNSKPGEIIKVTYIKNKQIVRTNVKLIDKSKFINQYQ